MNKNAMVINKKLVDEFFFGLNEAEIEYVLIKNICEELPCNLRDGKDIDILVHTSSVPAFKQAMLKMNFKQIVAPYGIREGWSFGYQLNEYQFWRKNNATCNFFIDAAEKLMCKSLMPKMWIPIDNTINESIWRDKVFDTKNNWWSMDEDNVAAYLIIRSVFD